MVHSETKPGRFESSYHSLSHERMSTAVRAKRANERMDELVARYLSLFFGLFWTIVPRTSLLVPLFLLPLPFYKLHHPDDQIPSQLSGSAGAESGSRLAGNATRA